MNALFNLNKVCLAAFVAASAIASLSLGNVASAATDGNHFNEGTLRPGGSPQNREASAPSVSEIVVTKIADMAAKMDEFDQQFSGLSGQVDGLNALLEQIEQLSEEVKEEQASSASKWIEELARVTDASTTFNDQISSLLDPEVAQQVKANLERLQAQYTATATFEDGHADALTDGLLIIRSALDNVQDAITELDAKKKEASAPIIASYDLATMKK